jgi:hypothetical protein
MGARLSVSLRLWIRAICLKVIDEGFRAFPRRDYLKLGELRDMYKEIPWIALTATAAPKVSHRNENAY